MLTIPKLISLAQPLSHTPNLYMQLPARNLHLLRYLVDTSNLIRSKTNSASPRPAPPTPVDNSILLAVQDKNPGVIPDSSCPYSPYFNLSRNLVEE